MSKYDASSQSFRDSWKAAKDIEHARANDPVKKTGHYAEAPSNVTHPGGHKYKSKFSPENKNKYGSGHNMEHHGEGEMYPGSKHHHSKDS